MRSRTQGPTLVFPLTGEAQEPYRHQWIIPPKATPLPGGALKSGSTTPRQDSLQPWHLREPTPTATPRGSVASTLELVDRGPGSSVSNTQGPEDAPSSRPVFHPTKFAPPLSQKLVKSHRQSSGSQRQQQLHLIQCNPRNSKMPVLLMLKCEQKLNKDQHRNLYNKGPHQGFN